MSHTSEFALGNKAMRQKLFEEALAHYDQARKQCPALANYIDFNIKIINSRLKDRLEKPQKLDFYSFELIRSSGLFDSRWYLENYQEEYCISNNPLAHYLEFGAQKGLNPSKSFNTNYYLKNNPDITLSKINPLIHYVTQGFKEGRKPLPSNLVEVSEAQETVDLQYVPYIEPKIQSLNFPAKIIAFYLPQFHPIPENDEWWGKGFTEWTNVKPALPQFSGHYQPHIPDTLGYYDLLDKNIQRKQIALAKAYGIGGFCFHYYWFTGKRLLEKPVDNYLNDKSLNFPYCLCWANENWTRRWDGRDSDILIGQKHSHNDDIAFISSISVHFKDNRYIKIFGKPILIVYRPSLLPDAKATAKRWRDWCKDNGIGEIHLAMTHSFEKTNPLDIGFDSAVEFPPNNYSPDNITEEIADLDKSFQGNIYNWRDLVSNSDNYSDSDFPIFRGVCPSWDNTPRKKDKATILFGSSPREYQKWLVNALADTTKNWNSEEGLVFVNAWNEWAEGAHLEPDARYGHAYLEATRNAILRAIASSSESSVALDNDVLAVVIHSFYPEVLDDLMRRFKQVKTDALKFYVTCPPGQEHKSNQILQNTALNYELLVCENRGRDILPFFKIFPKVVSGRHRAILKLHTKKSRHRKDGDQWCDDLYTKLVSEESIPRAISVFRDADYVGIIAPEGHIVSMSSYWGSNQENVLKLAARLGVSNDEVFALDFVAGSMMFMRTFPLIALHQVIDHEMFETESGQTDGTLAHAIERIFAILMKAFRMNIIDNFSNNNLACETNHCYEFATVG